MTTFPRWLIFSFFVSFCFAETVDIQIDGETVAETPPPNDCALICSRVVEENLVTLNQALREATRREEGFELERQKMEDYYDKKLTDLLKEASDRYTLLEASALQCRNEATQREEDFKAERKELETQMEMEIKAQSKDSSDRYTLLETSALKCQKQLEESSKFEEMYRTDVEAQFQAFRTEIELLKPFKDQAEGLENVVESLKGELEVYRREIEVIRDAREKDSKAYELKILDTLGEFKKKEEIIGGELSEAREMLRKEIDNYKLQIRKAKSDFSTVTNELFYSNERVRELHELVTTTYVNMTLIRDDFLNSFDHGATLVVAGIEVLVHSVKPVWDRITDFTQGSWSVMKAEYTAHVAPIVIKMLEPLQDFYEAHIRETVVIVIEPIQEALIILHNKASTALSQVCRAAINYIELSDGDIPFHRNITETLRFTEERSNDLMNNVFMVAIYFLGLWFVMRLLFCILSVSQPSPTPPPIKIAASKKGLRVQPNSRKHD